MNVKLLFCVFLTGCNILPTTAVFEAMATNDTDTRETTVTSKSSRAHGGNDTTETTATTEVSTTRPDNGTTETTATTEVSATHPDNGTTETTATTEVSTTHPDNGTTETTATTEVSTTHPDNGTTETTATTEVSTTHPDNGTTENSNTTGDATSSAASSTEIHTTEMQTTAPVSTTTLSPDQHNTINVNTSCVMLVGDIQWTIPYNDTSGTLKTTVVGIQQSLLSNVNGTCFNETVGQVLNMWLKNDTWRMSITFQGDSKNIWWSDVSLHYVYEANLFTNYSGNGSVNHNYTFSKGFMAPKGGSYLCNAETSTDLSNGYKLHTWNLQYTAFQTNVTKFPGDTTECDADKKTSSVVPIAVGAALAALVLIVLIAYLIGRRRNRKGYESLNI